MNIPEGDDGQSCFIVFRVVLIKVALSKPIKLCVIFRADWPMYVAEDLIKECNVRREDKNTIVTI